MEVTLINRQRYMAELSKLLTFMYKEDRSEILQHYNELLDGAEDEQAMLESFGSPTRLAVTISRTYQRDDRKLSVRADSKTGETEDAPRPAAPVVRKTENEQPTQSYAEIIEEIRREKAAEQGLEYTPMFFDEPEEKQEEPEPETEPEAESEPEQEPEAEEEAETEDVQETAEETEDSEAATEEAPAEDEPQEGSEGKADVSEEQAEPEESEEPVEGSDAEEAAEAEDDAESTESEAPEADEAEAEESGETEAQPEPEESEGEVEDAAVEEVPAEPVKVRKTNAALLVLYLIFAIPIGLLLYALLITLDLALLCVGLGVAAAAAQTLSFAFSGMAVFADTILVFGAGLVAAAVALVLLWFAIWLSIKDIGALSRGIVALGRKVCVREVEVNE